MTHFEALDAPFFTQYGFTMEHAVPQNVTSFEFHLVGDMTLKQFGYLATGMALAYLAFVILLPVSPYLAIPIIGLSGLSGVAFAFFPISDRPLDHWLIAFLKAVYSPTQGTWYSSSGPSGKPNQDPRFVNRLQLYLSTIGQGINQKAPVLQTTPPTPPSAGPTPSQSQTAQEPTPTPQTSSEISLIMEMQKYINSLQEKVAATEKQLRVFQTQAPYRNVTGQAPRQPIPIVSPPPPQPKQTQPQPPTTPKPPEIRVREPLKTQLILTASPNVINGVVTDANSNYLENVIVTIHDKNGVPVRALKTNKLGQFTGATPLADGTYNVSFEKENLEFDPLQVVLQGEVVKPLSVAAKKGLVL